MPRVGCLRQPLRRPGGGRRRLSVGGKWQVQMSEDREGQEVRGEWRSRPRGAASVFMRSWVFSRGDTGSPRVT